MTNIAISIAAYKRIDTLIRVLDSIRSADQQNIQIKIFVSADYHSDEVIETIQDYDVNNILINNPRLGCNANTLNAIEFAINQKFSNYILHIEDDTILAKDCLQYASYVFNRYEKEEEALSITCYNKTVDINDTKIYDIESQEFFCAWGCGFWADKFGTIKQNWTKHLTPMNGGVSWDSYINHSLFSGGPKYKQIKPTISRIQNIGDTQGTYVSDAIWHFYNQRTPFTSDDINKNIDWGTQNV